MIEIVALIFALIGADLVTARKSNFRLYGFMIWVVSNSMWAVYGVLINNLWLSLQFLAFLILSLRGVWTNRQEAE